MRELILYSILIFVAAIFVFINYKKGQSKLRGRKHRRFRDSYLEKKREKNKGKDNEDLHENRRQG